MANLTFNILALNPPKDELTSYYNPTFQGNQTGYVKMLKNLNIEAKNTIFAPIVPAKPLYNAQIGRSSFFIGLCFLLLIKHSL